MSIGKSRAKVFVETDTKVTESPFVCNRPDVVCFRLVICSGRSHAKANGSPPISSSPVTSAASESRRASSLRIVA